MKFGLSLCPEAGRWRDTVAQARLAEALGYDSVWLPEHHLMAGYAPTPMLGLAGLVEVTGTVTLGTNIAVVPFAHPVRLAEDAALLQDMSEGRFVFGVGLGYRENEFAALGVPFAERGGRMDESLEIIRRLWAQESVTYRGRYFLLDNVTIYPRLDQPPPMWVGGWSRPAIERAARQADAWFPGPTADLTKVQQCLDLYDAVLTKDGRRRAELPIFREVWVASDSASMEVGRQALEDLYQADYVRWRHSNVTGAADLGADRFIVGDPEVVAAAIVRLADELGVTHLCARLHFHTIPEEAVEAAMTLFATEVRPLVAKELGR